MLISDFFVILLHGYDIHGDTRYSPNNPRLCIGVIYFYIAEINQVLCTRVHRTYVGTEVFFISIVFFDLRLEYA